MLTPVEMFYIGYAMGAATVALGFLITMWPSRRRRGDGD